MVACVERGQCPETLLRCNDGCPIITVDGCPRCDPSCAIEEQPEPEDAGASDD
jgi:hypothetical protein